MSDALNEPKAKRKKPQFGKRLTDREEEVLRFLASGKSVKEIAADFNLSEKTVESHKFNLMAKLDLHNKAELVTYVLQRSQTTHLMQAFDFASLREIAGIEKELMLHLSDAELAGQDIDHEQIARKMNLDVGFIQVLEQRLLKRLGLHTAKELVFVSIIRTHLPSIGLDEPA